MKELSEWVNSWFNTRTLAHHCIPLGFLLGIKNFQYPKSIALAFPSCSSPWFPVYPDPFPVASPAFPNSDRVSLEHIQEPYLHPDLQATLRLQSFIGLFNSLMGPSINDLSMAGCVILSGTPTRLGKVWLPIVVKRVIPTQS